jgi:hypothetical protein
LRHMFSLNPGFAVRAAKCLVLRFLYNWRVRTATLLCSPTTPTVASCAPTTSDQRSSWPNCAKTSPTCGYSRSSPAPKSEVRERTIER